MRDQTKNVARIEIIVGTLGEKCVVLYSSKAESFTLVNPGVHSLGAALETRQSSSGALRNVSTIWRTIRELERILDRLTGTFVEPVDADLTSTLDVPGLEYTVSAVELALDHAWRLFDVAGATVTGSQNMSPQTMSPTLPVKEMTTSTKQVLADELGLSGEAQSK